MEPGGSYTLLHGVQGLAILNTNKSVKNKQTNKKPSGFV